MFYSSSDDFGEIDGRLFRRARAIERELRRVDRRNRRRSASAPRRLPAL